jgi:hypothetical protein
MAHSKYRFAKSIGGSVAARTIKRSAIDCINLVCYLLLTSEREIMRRYTR